MALIAACANERGYAIVAQDTRGKARSDGGLDPFCCEARDGFDSVEWVASQPWCDGRVTMWGASYYGFTEWAAASTRHPALRAIVPLTTTSFIGNDWLWRQGVFELGFAATWCAATWVDRYIYDLDLPFNWDTRPLRDVLPAAAGKPCPALDWMASQSEDAPVWLRLYGGRAPSQALAVPALHIGGWWDYFNRGQIVDWAIAASTSRHPQPLMMSAIDHYLGAWSQGRAELPAFDEGPEADPAVMAADLMAAPLDFLDDVIGGRPQPARARVRWELTHVGWREDDSWPPPRGRMIALYLNTDGDPRSAQGAGLASEPEAVGTWAHWVHDPSNLVPTTANLHGMRDLLDPPDDGLTEGRPDVLVFSTEPLVCDLDIAGPTLAHLQVGATSPSMHVIVRLLDVAPDGLVRRIRDGAALVRGAPDGPHVVVDLGHTGYRVRRDHRLRVHVCSSDFPRYMPYFGDDSDPWSATDGHANSHRLRVGGARGARLLLSVL